MTYVFGGKGPAKLSVPKLPGQMKVRRRRLTKTPEEMRIKAEKEEENLPETVKGKSVGSTEEARVAVALPMLGLDFQYQVSIAGGRRFPGGLIIDFVVETTPLPTPLQVQGRYWHGVGQEGGRAQDVLELAKIKRIMGHSWADPVEVWDNELTSVAQALMTVASALRLGGS